MKAKHVVELDNVTLVREHNLILDRVSFGVARKTLHAIVGPNGAGKSSLLHALLGELDFEGSIKLGFDDRATIGFVPQRLEVDRTLPVTVLDFLALSRQKRPLFSGISRAAREAALRTLKQVGLEHLSSRPLGTLSGGELQRVLIADAIDPAPELLLLDEPAAGLDERAIEQLGGLLQKAREDFGTTVIFVAHDLRWVKQIADRVTRIERGTALTGRPDELLA